MRLALSDARRGIGHTSPNPAVGAVIVRAGRLLAHGWHRKAGQPHAEIEAMRALKRPAQAKGATLYVTLEPCSTRGRTPPCVEAIIAAGIARVVVGAIDPNPHHAGRGIALLRKAGVKVTSGILEKECADLNPGFNKWITQQMPWVIAKAAMSLDGRLTRPPGEGQWLTSKATRADAMHLRARVDAILIGANTLRTDNPRLTLRKLEGYETKEQPWRVVISRGQNPLPKRAHLFTDAHRERTLVFRGKPLRTVLKQLAKRGVTSVLIEGGMRVLGEAFDRKLVDEVCFYLAPLISAGPVVALGGKGAGSSAESLRIEDPRYTKIGTDVRMTGKLAR